MSFPVQKSDQEWQALLQDKGAEAAAFQVTRHAATERPFTGKYEQFWACLLYTSDAADECCWV